MAAGGGCACTAGSTRAAADLTTTTTTAVTTMTIKLPAVLGDRGGRWAAPQHRGSGGGSTALPSPYCVFLCVLVCKDVY
ncbi:hypothetical protein EE612_050263 [Oryza sativa]|nr:hypothetical protein EE612_050263 [Oryza sativa]